MPANDQALRRALSRHAAATRWGNPDAADDAAREARTLQLEQQIRRALGHPPLLTDGQRLRLAQLLMTGDAR